MIALTDKQRMLSVAGATLLAAAVFYAYAVRPAADRVNSLNRILPEKQKVLRDLCVSSRQYLALRQRLDDIEKQQDSDAPPDPLAFIESAAARLDLTKNIAYLKKQSTQLDAKYSEITAELRLENISLQQLCDLLRDIETSRQPLRTRSLFIEKSHANPNLLHVVAHIAALARNEST